MNNYCQFLFALVLSSIAQPQSVSAAEVCTAPPKPPEFVAILDEVQKSIQAFANKKLVAGKADAMLSKLLQAKSPVILSWMSKRDAANKTEDAVVKEWRTYFAKNFILTKYPQNEKGLNREMESLVNKVLKRAFSEKDKNRLQKLFVRAQSAALKKIAIMPSLTSEARRQLESRISKIKLYWPATLQSARNNSLPLDILDWGIAYDPTANEINMGLHALGYPNDETYLAVFAHEIGHSIDSCRWGAFMEGSWPFTKIGECLRSSMSVGAKKRDDGKLDALLQAGQLSSELVGSLKQNPTCNKLVYPPPGIQADQLPESFADWFSAEVLAEIDGLQPRLVRNDLCEAQNLIEGSSYPSNQARVERIYRAQPHLKKGLTEDSVISKTSAKYCAMEKP